MKQDLITGGKVSLFKKSDGKVCIEGYACLWEVYSALIWESFYWIFDRHMLDGVLELPDLDCKANLNHDNRDILARYYPEKNVTTLELSIDDTGLKYCFEPPDTTLGRDTVENVRNGNLVGSSMAVIMDSYEFSGKHNGYDVRRGLKCSWLGDICLTPDPAFPATSVDVTRYSLFNTKEDYLSMQKPAESQHPPDEYFKNVFSLIDIDRQ